MKKLRTAHNAVPFKGYVTEKPSLTIPGQVMSLRTVVERYRRGQHIETFTPIYNPDFPPGYESLSKLDRLDMARSQARNVRNIRTALSKQAKEEAHNEAKRNAQADYLASIKEQSDDKQ